MKPDGDALFYVADPMCSWCWGFQPVLREVAATLPAGLPLRYVMGGLAPDSDEPMPEATRAYVQGAWRAVAERTGARFNHDFWTKCAPRRSTYTACRAVLAAGLQGEDAGPGMFEAIQRAYYTEARNPSDASTLVELAGELAMDAQRFERDLASPEVEALLNEDLALSRDLGVGGFPTLVLRRQGEVTRLSTGYVEAATILDLLEGVR